MARSPHVLGVLLGRIVFRERGLDPALRLRRVARLQGALRREPDSRAGAMGGDGRCKPGGAASDHEHVEGHGPTQGGWTLPELR